MEVYFIRHKDEKRPQIIQYLKEEKRIAIFFLNEPLSKVNDFIESGNPMDLPYDPKLKKCDPKSYWTALKYFKALSDNGGYLFVEYGDAELTKKATPQVPILNSNESGISHRSTEGLSSTGDSPTDVLINSKRHLASNEVPGELPKKSKGCFFVEIEKGTPIEELNIPDDSDPIHITLKYTVLEEVNYSDYPVLLAIRPPFCTICKPDARTYTKIAEYLRDKNKLPSPSIDFLHPKMMEQMCVEYLIKRGLDPVDERSKLNYCFLKPGKTLAYIDIAGRLINGQILYAQVKNSPINKRDEAHFNEFIKDQPVTSVIFADFKNDKQNTSSLKENMYKIDIQDVFNYFKHNEQMMRDMIGFPLKSESLEPLSS